MKVMYSTVPSVFSLPKYIKIFPFYIDLPDTFVTDIRFVSLNLGVLLSPSLSSEVILDRSAVS